MTAFYIVCWTITALSLMVTALNIAAGSWYRRQSTLYWTNFAEAEYRDAHKPWYVRLSQRLTQRWADR